MQFGINLTVYSFSLSHSVLKCLTNSLHAHVLNLVVRHTCVINAYQGFQQPNDAVCYSVIGSPLQQSAETASRTEIQVDLKRNEAYGVRGEVQVAAINGTTDAVCYSIIADSPGQQSGEATSGAEVQMNNYSTSVI